MSTKQSQATDVASTNNSGEEEEDLGALIYRESQLRKAEAAAIAIESKNTRTASTHRRTEAAAPTENDLASRVHIMLRKADGAAATTTPMNKKILIC